MKRSVTVKSKNSHIKVIGRLRPLSEEEAQYCTDIIDVNGNELIVNEPRTRLDLSKYTEAHKFTFHRVYKGSDENEMIFGDYLKPRIRAMINGSKNGACFAFGQTGSGKTYTMLGKRSPDSMQLGLVQHAVGYIFEALDSSEFQTMLNVKTEVERTDCSLSISLFEIYCGKLYDLLNDRNQVFALESMQGDVVIKSLTKSETDSYERSIEVIETGLEGRITSANSVNDESSRSHCILRVDLLVSKRLHGSYVFVDLAGAEKASMSQFNKQTSVDGAEINKSLLALKECIRAIDSNRGHIPFRDSELTKVLRHCFISSADTLMIANVTPSNKTVDQTLNTLRYADMVAFSTNSANLINNPGKAMKTVLSESEARKGWSRRSVAAKVPSKPQVCLVVPEFKLPKHPFVVPKRTCITNGSDVWLLTSHLSEKNKKDTPTHDELVEITKLEIVSLCTIQKNFLIKACQLIKGSSSELKKFSQGALVTSDYLAEIRETLQVLAVGLGEVTDQMLRVETLVHYEQSLCQQ